MAYAHQLQRIHQRSFQLEGLSINFYPVLLVRCVLYCVFTGTCACVYICVRVCPFRRTSSGFVRRISKKRLESAREAGSTASSPIGQDNPMHNVADTLDGDVMMTRL